MGEKLRSEYALFSLCLISFSICPRSYLLSLVSDCFFLLVYFRLLVDTQVKLGHFKHATNCACVSLIHPHGYLA